MPTIIDPPISKKAPCYGCEERFPACHDKCPKDLNGGYGYQAWKDELEAAKIEKRIYEAVIRDSDPMRDSFHSM